MINGESFSGPLFKRLTRTDANECKAKVSGPTLLVDIRDFFPRPSGSKDHVPVRVILVDDAGDVPEILGEMPATIQAQGEPMETMLSDINILRDRCRSGDILTLEPSTDRTDLFRVTRVARTSPRFAQVDLETGGEIAGLLSSGILPRERIKNFLRARSDEGQLVSGNFSIAGAWPDFEITFESGDGKGRNGAYRHAVALVLSRLPKLGGTLMRAEITSKKILTAGVNASFEPKRFLLPLKLDPAIDFLQLSKALGTAGGKVDSSPETSGSTTRRMTLAIRLSGAPVSLHMLEEHLAGVRVPGAPDPAIASKGMPVPPASAPLVLEDDLAVIDSAWGLWTAALEAGSRSVGGRLRFMDATAVVLASRSSLERVGATDIQLGVHASGAPWTLEINAPRKAADANGLATVARDASGNRFLLRQGWLQANPDSDGEVRGELFRKLTGLVPVQVSGETTPTPRQWYIVADLEQAPADVCAQTSDFVLRCAEARAATISGSLPITPSPPLVAGDEVGGTFTRKAIVQPEMEVNRVQGEVWLKLQDLLKSPGPGLSKLRHQAGYEVDGIIGAGEGRILLEIKTGKSAADVYEGVGQLMVYSKMLGLEGHRKVLLLAFKPSAALVEAAEACGIDLYSYSWVKVGEGVEVELSADFLAACGLPSGKPVQ